jgi:serine/threonine protein kinase
MCCTLLPLQVDVWALGITAIEMAECTPPRWAVHPLRVIFMINREAPPTLQEKERWGALFHDFIAQCLQKVSNLGRGCGVTFWHPLQQVWWGLGCVAAPHSISAQDDTQDMQQANFPCGQSSKELGSDLQGNALLSVKNVYEMYILYPSCISSE